MTTAKYSVKPENISIQREFTERAPSLGAGRTFALQCGAIGVLVSSERSLPGELPLGSGAPPLPGVVSLVAQLNLSGDKTSLCLRLACSTALA